MSDIPRPRAEYAEDQCELEAGSGTPFNRRRAACESTTEPANGTASLSASPKTYRWVVSPPKGDAAALASDFGVHPLVARVLLARGWEPGEDLRRFIDPLLKHTRDPFCLKDMDKACDRLARAVAEREPVLVYGDYDVDGSTATAVLVKLFRFLNVPVQYYIPDRLTEGYGVNVGALEKIARRFRLVVTVDTGTTCLAEADYARRHGIDLVITDHHRQAERLPEAVAIVNPNRCDCPYPEKTLAGVGVAFKLAHALLRAVECDPAKSVAFLGDLLDLVALGTICDMVPLLGENRAFCRRGLKEIAKGKRPGIRALKLVSGFEFDQELSPQQIGFGLGPRLNAAGRTAHASTAVDLLLEDDEAVAFKMAEKLDALNEDRRRIERSMVEDAQKEIACQCDLDNERVVVCGGRGWHVGVIGIVASRVLERYSRPAIVCAIDDELDVAKGSGRSVQGFNLHQALSDCSDFLLEFGGHEHAAGLRLKASRMDEFREAINAHAREHLAESDMVPLLKIDAEMEFGELTYDAVEALRNLAPFGQDNCPPMLLMRGVSVEGEPRVVGRNHLKMRVRSGTCAPVDVIGFNQAHHLKAFMEGARVVDLCGRPSLNQFRGVTSLQFELKDLRVAGQSIETADESAAF